MEKVNNPEKRLKANIGEQTKKTAKDLKEKINSSKKETEDVTVSFEDVKRKLDHALGYAKKNPIKIAVGAVIGIYLLRARASRKLIGLAARSTAATGLGLVAQQILNEPSKATHHATSTIH